MATVLFLDDEQSILNTYKRAIYPLGIKGVFAKNTIDAFSILNNEEIDMIVSDYRLENETGLDFLKKLRDDGSSKPMIIISGYAEESFIKDALNSHIIQDYVIKPVPLNLITNLLIKYAINKEGPNG